MGSHRERELRRGKHKLKNDEDFIPFDTKKLTSVHVMQLVSVFCCLFRNDLCLSDLVFDRKFLPQGQVTDAFDFQIRTGIFITIFVE